METYVKENKLKKIPGIFFDQKRMDKSVANDSINRELSALKKTSSLAARCTPSKVAQIPYIPMLKENNVRKRFFEHGDFLALRDTLPDYLKGFAPFGYRTGCRVSEISNLIWSQVKPRPRDNHAKCW